MGYGGKRMMEARMVKAKGRKDKNKSDLSLGIKGIVTARKCKHCQHHEIGIVTDQGRYMPLKLGRKVILIKG
jgi:hypothetical protein